MSEAQTAGTALLKICPLLALLLCSKGVVLYPEAEYPFAASSARLSKDTSHNRGMESMQM